MLSGNVAGRAAQDAMGRRWETKTFITGGIGSSAQNEGITKAFDLLNDTAYCETCAGIALALWSRRCCS
jgi:DUF1680 family protein